MSQPFLRLCGFTRVDRNDMTQRVDDALAASGAWIVNFAMFSNKATAIAFAIPGDQVPTLGSRLNETGLRLDGESLEAIAGWPADALAGVEIRGSLHLTFIHVEPDLRRTIPVIPG